MKYFDVVGVLGAGGAHLEANRLGQWAACGAERETLVLRFPRSSGMGARKVGVKSETSPGPDYMQFHDTGWWMLPILKGAVLYSPTGAHKAGGVVRAELDIVFGEEPEDGVEEEGPEVACACLQKAERRLQKRYAKGNGTVYEFDPTNDDQTPTSG